MNDYIWKNIEWNTDYNDYWAFAGSNTESQGFKNLQKCFREVFGLEVTSNGSYISAYMDGNIPVIYQSGAMGGWLIIKNLPANGRLSMKRQGSNSAGSQIRYADVNGQAILTLPSNNEPTVTFYFGEIGISQPIMATYLFDKEQLDNLNTESAPYLQNTIRAVSGSTDDFSSTGTLNAYSSVDKDYKSSLGNNTISSDLLNQIGVNKLIVPRYKILENNDEHHFEALSFPSNRKQMEEIEKQAGQFCHDGDLQLASDQQVDAKYWSTIPHIYPEVVFNNTTSVDADYISPNGSDKRYTNLKTHSIAKTTKNLTVDGHGVSILPNDSVICYIRKQGTYTPHLEPSLSNKQLSIGRNSEIQTDIEATSTIEFQDMLTYDITTDMLNTSFTADVDNLELFTNYPVNNQLYNSIIYTCAEWPMEMLTLTGHAYGATEDLIGTLGTYSYEASVTKIDTETIKHQKDLTFTTICSVKNFTCIDNTVTPPTLWDIADYNYDCYVKQPEYSNVSGTYMGWVHDMRFYVEFTSWVGSLPKNMGFFKNHSETKDASTLIATDKTTLEIQDLTYSYIYWYNDGYTTLDHSFTLKTGYVNRLQTDTFAMAIVVWRNGQLMDDTITITPEKWKLRAYESGSYSIIGYLGTDTNVVTPETYQETPIDKIEANAFADTAVESIKTDIVDIEDGAFYQANSLKTLELPYIPNSFFGKIFGAPSYADNYKYVPYSLENVSFDSYHSIPNNYFYNCYNIKKIEWEQSWGRQIGEYAFYSCDSLSTVDLRGVSTIGKYAFYQCESLLTVDLTDVTDIGIAAFAESGIESIKWPTSYAYNEIMGSTFENCKNLTTIKIPRNVKTIQNNAFYGCTNLTSVYIPIGVEWMSYQIFWNSPHLTIYFEGSEDQLRRWHPSWNSGNYPVTCNTELDY